MFGDQKRRWLTLWSLPAKSKADAVRFDSLANHLFATWAQVHLTGRLSLLIGAAVTVLFLFLFGSVTGGKSREPQDPPAAPVVGAPPNPIAVGPIRTILIGADGRISTSKTTAFAWTLAVVFMIATIATVALAGNSALGDLLKPLSNTYLLLLGGPFAALVLAKGITVSRVQGGTLVKQNVEPVFKPSDLTSNDSGQTSLVDFQFLMFNALAIVYVLIRFCIYPGDGLPEVPAVLAGITSVSALTYTANKAVASSTPLISGVQPPSVARGNPVVIVGSQLGGMSAQVFLDDAIALVANPAEDTELKVVIPDATAAGSHTLTVSVPSATQTLQAKTGFQVT